MAEMEAKRMKELEHKKMLRDVESDEMVVSLDAQLNALIKVHLHACYCVL